MTYTESSFDTEEWLHLALHANSTNNPHACMTYLKELLKQEPGHASAIYLLAVQHAEIGLTRRAISGMEAALAIEPGLEMARFQLGLLLLDGNRAAAAREHFTVLQASKDSALRGYSEALTALSEGNTALAREKLALESSKPSNSALSAMMRRLLDRLASGDAEKSKPEQQGNEIFLGAYRNASF